MIPVLKDIGFFKDKYVDHHILNEKTAVVLLQPDVPEEELKRYKKEGKQFLGINIIAINNPIQFELYKLKFKYEYFSDESGWWFSKTYKTLFDDYCIVVEPESIGDEINPNKYHIFINIGCEHPQKFEFSFERLEKCMKLGRVLSKFKP